MSVRRSPKALGRCTRWLRSLGQTCGKSARYEVYEGAQVLCKECYARFKAGRETFFYAPPHPPSPKDLWEARQRLTDGFFPRWG